MFIFDQTIAVIQAGHGLLQLGSCKIVSFLLLRFLLSCFFDLVVISGCFVSLDSRRSSFCVEDEANV